MPLVNYLPTQIYARIESLTFEPKSIYVFAQTEEARTIRDMSWLLHLRESKVKPVQIIKQSSNNFDVIINDTKTTVGLRNSRELIEFWKSLEESTVYIDITGIDLQIWAPLMRFAIELKLRLFALYMEPADYVSTSVVRSFFWTVF